MLVKYVIQTEIRRLKMMMIYWLIEIDVDDWWLLFIMIDDWWLMIDIDSIHSFDLFVDQMSVLGRMSQNWIILVK